MVNNVKIVRDAKVIDNIFLFKDWSSVCFIDTGSPCLHQFGHIPKKNKSSSDGQIRCKIGRTQHDRNMHWEKWAQLQELAALSSLFRFD